MVVPQEKELARFVPIVCKLSVSSAADIAAIEAECSRPPWSEELLRREFGNPCSRIYGARIEGALVGFLICHAVVDESHIVTVGVLTRYRGYGIGKALLQSVLRELHESAIRWVTLEVRRSNAIARNLYEQLGFLEVGVRERYYLDNEEDGIVLKLNLQQFIHEFGISES